MEDFILNENEEIIFDCILTLTTPDEDSFKGILYVSNQRLIFLVDYDNRLEPKPIEQIRGLTNTMLESQGSDVFSFDRNSIKTSKVSKDTYEIILEDDSKYIFDSGKQALSADFMNAVRID